MPEPDDLTSAVNRLVPSPDVDGAWTGLRRRIVRRRAARVSGAAIVAAIVATSVVAVFNSDETPDDVVAEAPSTTSTTAATVTATTAPQTTSTVAAPPPTAPAAPSVTFGALETLPSAPLSERVAPTVIWTGTELVVWGGSAYSDFTEFADGARYNPSTRTWTPIQDIPETLARPNTGWTGSDLLVLADDGNMAWNAASDSWRTIASPPAPIYSYHTHTFADGVFYAPDAELRYDVALDAWSTMAAAPLELGSFWGIPVGSQLVISSKDNGAAWLYDIASDSWRELPHPGPAGTRPGWDSAFTYLSLLEADGQLVADLGDRLRVLPSLDAPAWIDLGPLPDWYDCWTAQATSEFILAIGERGRCYATIGRVVDSTVTWTQAPAELDKNFDYLVTAGDTLLLFGTSDRDTVLAAATTPTLKSMPIIRG